MTDIIERLKEPEAHYPGNFDTPKRANAMLSCLCQEAMEEIESLRQQLAEARQEIADRETDCATGHDQDEATIAELCQQLAEKDAEIDRLKALQARYISEREDILTELNKEQESGTELRQKLAAIEAREQQLREKVSELINAAPGHAGQCSGLKCREPYCYSCNDEDEADKYLQQVWDLCHSARELSKQTDTIALSAMIAKAGEVMRERCIDASEDYNGKRGEHDGTAIAHLIRAIPGVTLEDLK